VIQASPPFLVVHSNAAFARLTGIDSHKVVGRPIRSVLSFPNEKADRQVCGENSSTTSANPQSSEYRDTGESGPQNINWAGAVKQDSLERLVAASGFGHLHLVQVVSNHSQIVGKSAAFSKEPSSATSLRKIASAPAQLGGIQDSNTTSPVLGTSQPSRAFLTQSYSR
jgi:hypothetical protein